MMYILVVKFYFQVFKLLFFNLVKTKSKKKSPVEKKVAKPAKVQRSNSKGSVKEAKKRKPGPVKRRSN